MKATFGAFAAAAATLLVAGTSATATVMTATYTGSVYVANDALGIFEPPGSSYTFNLAFTYDKDLGADQNFSDAGSRSSSAFGYDSPIVNTVFTLNGVTISLGSSEHGEVLTFALGGDPLLSSARHYTRSYGTFNDIQIGGTISVDIDTMAALPGSLDHNVDPVVPDWWIGEFAFDISYYDPDIDDYVYIEDGLTGDLGIATYSVTGGVYPPTGGTGGEPPVDPVPEPASWAMLIAGFGLVGATLRRRRMVAA